MITIPVSTDSISEQDYIKQTLQNRPFFCFFPPVMEAEFLETRVKSSLYYIRSGQWLLLAMFLAIIVIAWVFFQDIFIVNDFYQLKFIELPLGLSILFIIYGHRISEVRANFHRVMFPVAVFVITDIQLHIFLTAETGYYLYAIFNQAISMLLIALGLRFTTKVLLLIYMLGGSSGLALGSFLHLPINVLAFSYYFVLFGVVITVLAWISERQERFAFLQELLVSYQSQELTRLNQQLDKIAHEDALTHIANRRSFNNAAEREWDIALREQRSLSLLLLDVDFFKRYNDTYGHESGDKCLQSIAHAIRDAMMRPADLAARYGGEEFVVLMPDTDVQGAIMVAERILRAVDECQIPHASSTVAPHVTVSIGITTLTPTSGQPSQDAIRQADEALYQVKDNGRHHYRIYQSGRAVV
jgi:diguanylate cyclase (GGDEF)-like protein